MLDYVKTATGFGKITNKRIASSRHTPSFTYAVHNRQALALVGQILPWLKSCKRLRAELIVRDYLKVTPRNGKYSPEHLERKTLFEKRVMEIRAHSDS